MIETNKERLNNFNKLFLIFSCGAEIWEIVKEHENWQSICFWLKKWSNTIFLTPKPIKDTLSIILKEVKKILEGATVVKFVNKVHRLQYLH